MGVDGAIYKSLEFTGPTIKEMTVSGRMTLCNMAVEMGAKNGIVEPDETTRKYLADKIKKMPDLDALKSDTDAEYSQTVEIDVSNMEPQVACPSSVDNVKPVSKVGNVKIDQAFIGSCTNGRLEDLQLAAKIMKGKKVADGVRALVIPASQEIYQQADKEGLLQIFTEAGAIVCGSACGPCLGGHIGLLAAGETCVSTSNRNFIGRMGSTQANVYLASPATVAASAIAGKIVDPTKQERKSIMTTIKAKAIKFGNNIDTDVILPGKYLVLVDPCELGKHALESLDTKFVDKAKAGIIIIGGKNFGCGSSREQAPLALKYAGVKCVIGRIVCPHILPQQHKHRLTRHRMQRHLTPP